MTQAITLIKSFEGCKLRAYQDGGGVWTIGYGATGPHIGAGVQWTQQQAEDDLVHRVNAVDIGLTKMAFAAKVALSPGEKSALISLIYNVGLEAVAKSTLWKLMTLDQPLGAALEFQKWSMDNGRRVRGLMRRRFLEAYEFLTE